jgi:hypothetical protein
LQKEPIAEFEGLLIAFCSSRAYRENSFWILHVLEESPHRLPGIILTVCAKFLERFSDEARDMSTGRAADVGTVAKLIFRIYQQHLDDEWASRCLDLMDVMLLEGVHDAQVGLESFDR